MRNDCMADDALPTNLSHIFSCTNQRVAVQQTCPALSVTAPTKESAACSTSISSNRTAAPLPPNSSFTGTKLRPQDSATKRPTSGEPVNVMRLIPACFARAAPAPAPNPVTILITPAGIPASSASLQKYSVERGVSSAGFTTTVFPAASAGAIPQHSKRNGKFHGTMNPHTP